MLVTQIVMISFCFKWRTFSNRVTPRWPRRLAKNQIRLIKNLEILGLNLQL